MPAFAYEQGVIALQRLLRTYELGSERAIAFRLGVRDGLLDSIVGKSEHQSLHEWERQPSTRQGLS